MRSIETDPRQTPNPAECVEEKKNRREDRGKDRVGYPGESKVVASSHENVTARATDVVEFLSIIIVGDWSLVRGCKKSIENNIIKGKG